MRISLRNVGNSRGIIIPAALLAACEIEDEVEVILEGKTLLLVPIHTPRAGWFNGYKPELDIEPLASFALDEGLEEWEW